MTRPDEAQVTVAESQEQNDDDERTDAEQQTQGEAYAPPVQAAARPAPTGYIDPNNAARRDMGSGRSQTPAQERATALDNLNRVFNRALHPDQ